jgi:hypothetical protein
VIRRISSRLWRGYTLVEVVGVMAALAVVMGVSLVSLTALRSADRRFARRMETQDLTDQLARQLRRDAHAATSAAWDAEQRELEFAMLAGGVVSYRLVDHRWERRKLVETPREGGAAQALLDGAFRLPEGAHSTVEIVDGERADLLRVTVSPAAENRDASRSAPLPLEIVAAVGADRERLAP